MGLGPSRVPRRLELMEIPAITVLAFATAIGRQCLGRDAMALEAGGEALAPGQEVVLARVQPATVRALQPDDHMGVVVIAIVVEGEQSIVGLELVVQEVSDRQLEGAGVGAGGHGEHEVHADALARSARLLLACALPFDRPRRQSAPVVLEGVTGRKTELAADGVEGIATRVKDFVLAIPRDVVQMSGETLPWNARSW